MIRPVRSKTRGLFDLNSLASDFDDFEASALKNKKKPRKVRTKQQSVKSVEDDSKVLVNYKRQTPVSKAKRDFMDKLSKKLFNQFSKKDWLMYWQYKAGEQGINYIILKGNYPKEYAILGSLMKNFEVTEIKLMIDFLWDCDHDIHNRRTMGTWILSKGWINSVYQSALLWRDGEYKTQSQQRKEAYAQAQVPARNREWVSSSEEGAEKEDKPKKNKIRI